VPTSLNYYKSRVPGPRVLCEGRMQPCAKTSSTAFAAPILEKRTITDAQNTTTIYEYDACGNRTAAIYPINGAAHATSFKYDIMNRSCHGDG
jgi:YD repeat-containing protein